MDKPTIGSEAVDALIAQLSPWDLLHLRRRARVMKIDGLKTIEDLPMDLVCYLSQFFDPEDLMRATQVSRTFRAMFGSDMVMETACSQLFPGLRESLHEGDGLLASFQKTLRAYSWNLPKDWTSHLERAPFEDVQGTYDYGESSYSDGKPLTVYSHGRLAYQLKNELKVVDVRTGTVQKRLVPIDRRKPRAPKRIVAISKDLLVVAQCNMVVNTGRAELSRVLHILSFDHTGEGSAWKSLTLPSALDRCYADSTRLIATCQSGQVYHWKWGGVLEELPACDDVSEDIALMPNPKRVSGCGPGAIFHPLEDTCFLVHVYCDAPKDVPSGIDEVQYLAGQSNSPPQSFGTIEVDPPTTKVYIVKYVRDDDKKWTSITPVNQWALEPPGTTGRIANTLIPTVVEMVCARADSHGSSTIAMRCCRYRVGQTHSSLHFTMTAVCFNVFNELHHTLNTRGPISTSGRNDGQVEELPSAPSNRDYVWNRAILRDMAMFHSARDSDPAPHITAVITQTDGLRWPPPTARGCNYQLGSFYFGPWPTPQSDPTNNKGNSHAIYIDDQYAVLCHETGFMVIRRRS